MRRKTKADDWVWLIDHSVQIGKQKVLAILAIRLLDLPMPERFLRPADLVLIDLVPMETSTREDVAARLKGAAARTMVPRVIVDDHGVDLNGGVQIFQQSHPETVEIYDAKHKAACLLKARLEKNPRWMAFCTKVGQTRCAVQQTELGALAPPGSKPKARFMNLTGQLNWADKILAILEGLPGSAPSWATPERLEAKFGWLREFREDLAEWRQWQTIMDVTVGFVGSEGLHAKTAVQLSRRTTPPAANRQGTSVGGGVDQVREGASEQSKARRAAARQHRSVGVVLREIQDLGAGQQAKGGFTSLLLGFGTLFAEATIENVLEAMRRVPTKEVWAWCTEKLGQTLFSQRKEAFAMVQMAQQK